MLLLCLVGFVDSFFLVFALVIEANEWMTMTMENSVKPKKEQKE